MVKAAHDLKAAEQVLLLPDPECPLDTVCFHAQQCAEKSLKGYLTSREIPFEKTHDLGQLFYLCREDAGLMEELRGIQRMTQYAVDVRYADAISDDPDRAEAEQAVSLARKAHQSITKRLKKV